MNFGSYIPFYIVSNVFLVITHYMRETTACTRPPSCCLVLCCSSACECHNNGTLTCDSINGQCFCRANVEGEQCNRCKLNFWGLHLGLTDGCIPCDCCDRTASVGCNQVGGSKTTYMPLSVSLRALPHTEYPPFGNCRLLYVCTN